MAAGLLALAAGSASAVTTIYVDDDNCPGPGSGTLADPYCAIQDAVDAAANGDTISIASGTYAETVTIKAGFSADGVTLQGDAVSRPVITGGVKFLNSGTINGITFENLYISGDAGGMVFDMDNPGTVNDFVMDNSVIDGGNTVGLHGFGGQNLGQSFTMTNNEFKDILNWSLMDINSGSGDGSNGLPLTSVTFSNNSVHDSDGSVALRGNTASKTTVVNVVGNTWSNIGSNNANPANDNHWAAVEVNHAVQANVTDNNIDDVSLGAFGEGQCIQVWDIDTLNVSRNSCTNSAQGIFVFGGAFGGGPWNVPGGAVSCNNIYGNDEFGLKVDPDALGGPLDGENNWWGSVTGPSDQGPGFGDGVSANVDFDPWLNQLFDSAEACLGVGGIVQMRTGSADPASALSEASDSSSMTLGVLVAAIAASGLALGAGAWYARRRWLR